MPDRLGRLEETFEALPIYFVTACTHKRDATLNDMEVHDCFIEFGQNGDDYGAWLGAYVIMPDHLHAFVVIDDERQDLSAWMKSLKNSLSKVLRTKSIPAPHWQKGFFDHVLRSEDSYSEKWEYGRDNPVRAGLAREWSDWPFMGEIFDLEFERTRN
jgi:REP element-mobilizing transposase RayT